MSIVVRIIAYIFKIVCFVPPGLLFLTSFGTLVKETTVDLLAIGKLDPLYLLGRSSFHVFGWAVVCWTLYFAWRTIATWRKPSCVPALLMTLPSFLLGAAVIFAISKGT